VLINAHIVISFTLAKLQGRTLDRTMRVKVYFVFCRCISYPNRVILTMPGSISLCARPKAHMQNSLTFVNLGIVGKSAFC
jgi:hypothetical protein